MFASLGRALMFFFDPALFGIVLKALLLTLVLFVALLVGAEYALHLLPTLGSPVVNHALELLAPIILIMGLFAAGAPVAAVFASLYLDKVADAIEARSYASDPKASGMSIAAGLGAGARLMGVVLVADLLLLPAGVFLPGAGQILTIMVNGFLLGREYFELAALRHISRNAAEALRKRNAARIFGGGLIISVLTAVPFADLFAPLFGAALMVHLYQRVAREANT